MDDSQERGLQAPQPRQRELLVMGRCSVDLYPQQVGVRLEDVTTFGKYLGGSATNVAVACARLGHQVSVLTGVGDDPFGRFIVNELGRFGVEAGATVVNADFNTPVTFCEMFPPDDFPLYFYRQPTTPDLEISVADLPEDLESHRILWLTASGLSAMPSRQAHHEAIRRHRRRDDGLVVLDLDHRPRFWRDEASVREQLDVVLPQVDIAIGNVDECRVATGHEDPETAARALLDLGLDVAIVKLGERGVHAVSREGSCLVEPTRVEVVNGLGAGDAFGGALCHGLLSGWELEPTLRFASAAGAIVASRLACAPDMPTTEEVEALLDARQGVQ